MGKDVQHPGKKQKLLDVGSTGNLLHLPHSPVSGQRGYIERGADRLAASELCGAVYCNRANEAHCWLHKCHVTGQQWGISQHFCWWDLSLFWSSDIDVVCALPANKNVLVRCPANLCHYWHNETWPILQTAERSESVHRQWCFTRKLKHWQILEGEAL